MKRIASDLYLAWDVIVCCSFFCIFLSYIISVISKYECMISIITWSGIFGTALSLFVFAYFFSLEA